MENQENNLVSSVYTRIRNHYEALRSGLGDGKTQSSEFNIANCCCCKKNNPNIESVWSQESYAFLEQPYNVDDKGDANGHLRIHPNLWENGASNHLSGVFEVLKDKIYQVRGYDMSNITFVRSNPPVENGSMDQPRWIVVDTLMSNECTEAAMKLFENYLQEADSGYSLHGNIVGMIISHSHIDHYGGMETVAKYFVEENNKIECDVKSPFTIAPAGFYDHAVSENVYLGNAMGRRASYQYGSFIKPEYNPDDPENQNVDSYTSGEISIGIGQGQSTGSPSAVGRPTLEVDKNTVLILDGLKVGFQLTPGTEAPAEMNNYFYDYNALWLAENCAGTLHNLYTLRGAEIRDAKAWASYLMETALLYGDDAEVVFQSHNWPHWKPENDKKYIRNFIVDTASIYKYIHDQTLLYMNMGYKMNEVADMRVLPRGIQKNWSLKPFYGTPVHNAKAVYQKYLGWYDANPIHLQELPPEQLAKEMMRYIQAGSKENMLTMIKDDIAAGNFWTAAYMANQMFLCGDKDECVDKAKDLCASALQQLGYQCESGTWRNAYLSAAYELRKGKVHANKPSANSLGQMPPETLLDYISIFFDGERAATNVHCDMYLNVFEENADDINCTRFLFVVRNGAILYHKVEDAEQIKKISSSATSITIQDLRNVAIGRYDGPCEILSQISKAMVFVNCDRFRYFDIVDRHDSEVQLENGEIVDLKTEVEGCIQLLEKYTDTFASDSDVVLLSNKDLEPWERYYRILKKQTHVILEGDFFIPGDETMGIGNDNKFMSYELYYTLYSLYRYLYRNYLKNDYGYKFVDDAKSASFVKLKENIVLFETYVADCYLCSPNSKITFDIDDSNAWCYLNNVDQRGEISFTVSKFFEHLCVYYKRFSEKLTVQNKQ